jgi:CIC family chloride channel protein
VLANYLAENVFAESIYSLRLKRRGIRIQSGRDVDVLQGVTVAQVMTQHPDAVPHDMTLDGLSRELVRTGHHGFVILDKNEKFWGLVTRSDYQKARGRDLPETTTVCDFGVGRERLLLAYPDETLGEVLIRMSTRGVGRLPVIDRDDPTRLLGMVRRADVIQGYQVGLMYRAELQHHAKKVKLRNIDGTEFLEITLDPTSHWVGCELSSLARELPNNCVLVSIRRGTQVIIPKGYTIFEAGDQITAFVGSKDIHHVAQCFSEVDSMITRVVEEE